MNFCRLTILLHILYCLINISVQGQDINIKRIELDNEAIILSYDLKDTTQGRFYTVNLYSSIDNFINPIQNLVGDIGLEIRPGSDHKIQVNTRNEFGRTFEGKVAFELRAKVYIPFIRLDGFNDYKKFKRGKAYEIRWSGGRPQNVLNFDLYRGNKRVHTFSNVANRGKYTMIFPPNTKPGNDYRFKISDIKNNDEIVNTKNFAITSKVPLVVKVIPVIAIGSVLYVLLRPKEGCADCLPDFPSSPEN
jgi:hypothetical protein